MSITRTVRRAGLAAAAFAALTPAIVANAGHDRPQPGPQLTGRAVLPVETYAIGPPSGAFFGNVVTNGVQFPLPSQPVEGFSGIVDGRCPGEFLAMPDNGFGNKANSADFLIRAYYIKPDFKTDRGGSGSVAVGDFISFRDPWGVIGFPITNEATRASGCSPEPTSTRSRSSVAATATSGSATSSVHGSCTSITTGRLLEPPIALPDGLMSPSNPHLGTATPTVNGSRGIEAMAISPNGRWLTVVLEGAVPGDDPFSRRIYQYHTKNRTFTRLADYRVEVDTHFVSDAQALDNHSLVVIERDGGRGLTANFRSVYKVDLRNLGADGTVTKTATRRSGGDPRPGRDLAAGDPRG